MAFLLQKCCLRHSEDLHSTSQNNIPASSAEQCSLYLARWCHLLTPLPCSSWHFTAFGKDSTTLKLLAVHAQLKATCIHEDFDSVGCGYFLYWSANNTIIKLEKLGEHFNIFKFNHRKPIWLYACEAVSANFRSPIIQHREGLLERLCAPKSCVTG